VGHQQRPDFVPAREFSFVKLRTGLRHCVKPCAIMYMRLRTAAGMQAQCSPTEGKTGY
jgi:hypothetical protein